MKQTSLTFTDPLAAFQRAFAEFDAAYDRLDARGGPMDYEELGKRARELVKALPERHPQADVLKVAVEDGIGKQRPHLIYWAAESIL